LVNRLEEVNEEHQQLQADLEEKTHESKHHLKELDIVMRECEELEVEITRNNKLQAAAREEAATLKKQANDLKDQVSTAQWALEQAEVEEENLRGKVVSSPDRRKQELYVRKERLQKVKQECAAVESEVQLTKTKVVNAMKAMHDLDATNTMLDDLQEEITKHQQLVQKIEETRKSCTATEKQTEAADNRLKEAQRQLERSETKIVQQRKQHEMQIQAVHEALDAAKKQLLRVEKDRRESMARVEAGEQEVRMLEEAMREDRVKTEHQIESMIAEYKQVEKAFLERNANQMHLIQSKCGRRAKD